MSRQTGVQLSIILDRLKESLNYKKNRLFFSTAKCLPNICMIFKFILLQKTLTELRKFRDQWRKEDPLLPYLDDNILLKMKNFIAECVQISWRMVNQLPPIKITQANKVHGERFEEFFEMEEEEVTERASTVTICVWPALTDSEGDEVLAKGKAAIIPRSQTHTFVWSHGLLLSFLAHQLLRASSLMAKF